MGGPGSGGRRHGAGRPRGSKNLCPPGFYARWVECRGCGALTYHRHGFCSPSCRAAFALGSIPPALEPHGSQPPGSVAVPVDDQWAWVSPEDAAAVGKVPWHLQDWYAKGKAWVGGRTVNFKMHRFILGLGPAAPWVDHVNGDRLDNRRENLRLVTPFESAQNKRSMPRRHPDSRRRGVIWHPGLKCWQVRVRDRYVGSFNTVAEADAAAKVARSLLMPFAVDDLEA